MKDESGIDYKVLAVPVHDPTPIYVKGIKVFPKSLLNEIAHFFEQYKALESGKWAKICGWENAEGAKQKVLESHQDMYQ